MLKRDTITRAAFTVLALAGFILLAAGCADLGPSPMAPKQEAAVSDDARIPVRAAKKVKEVSDDKKTRKSSEEAAVLVSPQESVTATEEAAVIALSQEGVPAASGGGDFYINKAWGFFYPEVNGTLSIEFPEYGDETIVRVRKVKFSVDKGMLDKKRKITMTATSGTTLDDVQVEFDPQGVQFHPPAKLEIYLSGGKRRDLMAYHYSASQVTRATIEKVSLGDDGSSGWKVTLEIPGFSRYSLGGDDYYGYPEAEDDECLVP